MTGFARVRQQAAEGEIVLNLKSVNHRGLDIHFHVAPELDPFEESLRAIIRQRVARGHMQVHAALNRTSGCVQGSLNRSLLENYLGAFRQAQEEFQLNGQPDLNLALRIPGMFRVDVPAELNEEFASVLAAAAEQACDLLNAFREREAAEIAVEMRDRCITIRSGVEQMEKIRSKATAAFQKRLKQRLGELLRGAGLEPQRLAQEAAVLADRSDISEELVRLRTHVGQVEELLNAGGEVGKKLDFLLQEMNRETNTILSKTGGLGEIGLTITDLALGAKAEIDKLREQSLNLE